MTDETTTRPAEDGEQLLTAEERTVAGALDVEAARSGSDAQLWAFAFDGPLRAQEALLAAMRLVGRSHLDLEDAAVVTKIGGRVRIQQTKDVSTGQGAISGAWLGTLAALFVGLPLVGAAVGAAVGGIFARLRDIGIDDGQMRAMGDELADGEAALFLLIRDCHPVRTMREVGRFEARLIATTATDERAAEVRDALQIDPWAG